MGNSVLKIHMEASQVLFRITQIRKVRRDPEQELCCFVVQTSAQCRKSVWVISCPPALKCRVIGMNSTLQLIYFCMPDSMGMESLVLLHLLQAASVAGWCGWDQRSVIHHSQDWLNELGRVNLFGTVCICYAHLDRVIEKIYVLEQTVNKDPQCFRCFLEIQPNNHPVRLLSASILK